jgi:hypothetical protein
MFEATKWNLREDPTSLKPQGDEVPLQKLNPGSFEGHQITVRSN